MSDYLTITGFSTALYSTWYFVDEISCLFDCGDGACSGLLQKSRKVKHIFITHPDRDHLAGLVQFCQLNGRPELSVYYPASSGSFPALAEFLARFDPQISGTKWIPLRPGDEVPVHKGVVVRAVENRHLRAEPGETKSLSYFVESIARKLKPEHVGKSGQEIARVRQHGGEEAVSDPVRHKLLVYTGDTPVEWDGRYQDAEILIHEATFLRSDELAPDDPGRREHSFLDSVLEMVSQSNVGALVLGHFSPRYSESAIRKAIAQKQQQCQLGSPIHVVPPGKIIRDLMSSE